MANGSSPHGKPYRIITATMAIVPDGERDVVPTIPEGAIIRVIDPTALENNRFVRAMWDDTTISMFSRDLRDRAEPIESSQAYAACPALVRFPLDSLRSITPWMAAMYSSHPEGFTT